MCCFQSKLWETNRSLLTVVAEAQSILNSRPLTQNSDDPTDAESLTPNHLIILKSNQAMSPGSFSKQDQCSQRRGFFFHKYVFLIVIFLLISASICHQEKRLRSGYLDPCTGKCVSILIIQIC